MITKNIDSNNYKNAECIYPIIIYLAWTHLDPFWPLLAVSQRSQMDPDGPVGTPVPLTKPCLCAWPMKPWVTWSDVSCGFYLDAQPEKAFTVWHCAVAVCQSVCPSVSQKESRKSLNKTARWQQRSSSSCVLFVNLADMTHYTKAIRWSLLDKPYGWLNNVFPVLL